MGSSTNTGPGVPDCAVLMALRSAGTMSRTVRTEMHALQSVLKSESWSMSCSAPRPFCSEAAAPPMSSSGDSAIWAFLMAVTALVTPGPAVTAATPMRPESLETASAAKTAVASCRVSTTRIPSFSLATRMGEMWPPASAKTKRTP